MRRRIAGCLVFSLTLASSAMAGALFNGTTLYWENDSFGVGIQSDRFYTNGVRVVGQLASSPAWAADLRRAFCNRGWCGAEAVVDSTAVLFGQNFYTPEIITLSAPQPQDRPWAGVLYAGVAESLVNDSGTVLHTFEANVGVLGPAAGAQRTQKFVHNDLGFSDNDPQGWRHQLRNEPVLSLSYRQARRVLRASDVFDVVPEVGLLVGSPQTAIAAGGVLRLGWHLSGFPVGTIPAAAARDVGGRPPFEAYVFAGGEGRWVPFNATLEGGLFRRGAKARDPKPFVTDLRIGLSLRYRRYRLTYTVVDRSDEFRVPAGHRGAQRFGSYALTFEPR